MAKISISLDNRDWGKVSLAVESYLGRERKLASEFAWPGALVAMLAAKELATFARIKQELSRQRKEARNAK